MSLFPAYPSSCGEKQSSTEQDIKDEPGTSTLPAKDSWLDNASFSIQLPIYDIPLPSGPQSFHEPVDSCQRTLTNETCDDTASSNDLPAVGKGIVKETAGERVGSKQTSNEECTSYRKSKKSRIKAHHHKSPKQSAASPTVVEDEPTFYKDKKKEKGFLKVSTLGKPVAPLYRVARHHILGQLQGENPYEKHKSSKRRKDKDRYFTFDFQSCEATPSVVGNPELSEEEQLSKQTAAFNKKLGEEPENIQVWLQYIKFQDSVWQFERTYRRGGGAQGIRVTAERKMSIVDKALLHNPDCEVLLAERGALAEIVFPADELSQQFQRQLEQHPKSMSLWRSYINATQCALSLCTASKVTELYGKAMMCFHQSRRGAPLSHTRPAEEKILDLLLECGLFLRQAGLHEQMWTLLHHSLELNLTAPSPDHFKVSSSVSEQGVVEVEETVLGCALPLATLWLRVERLRESVHWLPWVGDEDCEDPQRLAFVEDVSDLLHPVTTPVLGSRVVAVTLALLKVPALPARDTALVLAGPSRVPWGLDSPETLLAAAFPVGVVGCRAAHLLAPTAHLVAGPSYLSFAGQSHNLGQEHYLDLVTQVFLACGACLAEPARTACFVWWLRLERLLVVLAREKLCTFPTNRRKKLKTTVKEFLKHDLNRSNVLFYREYALIEREFGNEDSARGILRTALSTQRPGEPVIGIVDERDRARLCLLYRTLCELLLTSETSKYDRRTEAVDLLVSLSLGVSKRIPNEEFSPADRVSAAAKFRHITDELIRDLDTTSETPADGTEHLLPDFLIDWVTCHAWLLHLTKSTWEAAALLEEILVKIPPSNLNTDQAVVTLNRCRREALFESYISLLHLHCQETAGSFSVLNEVVQRSLKEFPNNLNFLATAARAENSESSPWWKLKRLFDDTNSQFARIFLVLLAKQRQAQLETSCEIRVVEGVSVPTVVDSSYKNRTGSLFRQLIADPITRRCPIIWRLYLQYLFEFGNDYETCRTTFYRALEECPWVKTLYMDGAKMFPGDIQQIQDLIIEKELRLHVTPEELDILRSKD